MQKIGFRTAKTALWEPLRLPVQPWDARHARHDVVRIAPGVPSLLSRASPPRLRHPPRRRWENGQFPFAQPTRRRRGGCKRWGRDSNPRARQARYRFSRPAHSTTLPPHRCSGDRLDSVAATVPGQRPAANSSENPITAIQAPPRPHRHGFRRFSAPPIRFGATM